MLGHGNPAQYMITSRYIESLKEMTNSKNSKVIFMPIETSSLLSGVGAIKEMLAETGEKRLPEDDSDNSDNRKALPSTPQRQLPG